MTYTLQKIAKSGQLVVAIATLRRREIVGPTVMKLANQNRLPDLVIVSAVSAKDVDTNQFHQLPFPVKVIFGVKGACVQRNRAMELVTDDDIIVFLDDDFLLAPDYLAQVEIIFAENPRFSLLTGNVIADGVGQEGYSHQTGDRLLKTLDTGERPEHYFEVFSGYGCNMATRMGHTLPNNIWFDENLPLYAWLEDLDFSRQLAKFGKIVKAPQLVGIHLGTKVSRSPGEMLGYSQIANPAFLARKGSMKTGRAQRSMIRNMIANMIGSLKPEPWIDRRGRLRGNLLGLKDLFLGKCSPNRILKLR